MKIENFTKFYHYNQNNDYCFKGHRHSGLEANIILSGNMEVTCGDTVFSCNSGSAVIFRSGIFHCCRVISNEPCEFISLHFSLENQEFTSPAVYQLNESDLSLLKIIEEDIIPFNDTEKGVIGASAKSLLEGFFTRLEDRKKEPRKEAGKYAELYYEAVKYMESQIDKNLNVPKIAKECGVCTTLLKNAFSQYTGCGIKEYFIDMKIQKAKDMLLLGERAESVSNKLGFSSASYFSQTFKRLCGVSPREFLKDK